MKRVFLLLVACLALLPCRAIGIDDCYRLARQNYPMVAQYDLTRRLGDFSFSNAARAWLPQVALLGQATWQSAVTAWPQELEGMFHAVGLDMVGLSQDQYKVLMQVSQPLWDGGAAKAQQAQARAQTAVDLLSIDQQIDQLNNRINQIYFGLLLMERNQETLAHTAALVEENLRVATIGIRNGVTLQSDADRLQVELLTLRQQQAQLEQTILSYRQMLSLLIGQPLAADEPIETPAVPSYDITASRRTELRLLDAQVQQLQAGRQLLRASVMPHIDLFAQGWYGRPGLNLFEDMMYDEFSWNCLVGLRLQWNISALWTHHNRQQSLQVQQQALQVQKETIQWNLSLQQTQLAGEIAKMRRTAQLDSNIVALRQSIRLATAAKYKNGVITATDLLSDITEENNARLTQSAHQLDLLRGLYDMKIHLNQ